MTLHQTLAENRVHVEISQATRLRERILEELLAVEEAAKRARELIATIPECNDPLCPKKREGD